MPSIFLSYARSDDIDPSDPTTSFVARLHRNFSAGRFEVWFDRLAMPSRGLAFHQEIQDAAAARERSVLIAGPKAAVLDNVRQEWQFALQADTAVAPINKAVSGDLPESHPYFGVHKKRPFDGT